MSRLLKRAIDIAGASLALGLLAPVLPLISLAIKLDSPGPVLFFQERIGRFGRPFVILKFRTMHVIGNRMNVTVAGVDNSDVTRIGRWLRVTGLDELPQLFNVLHGEMSLVGPRPYIITQDNHYARLIENYTRRQSVKPGITGWAQVNGARGEISTLDDLSRRLKLDLWYIANMSVSLDIRVLLKTLPLVFAS